MRFFIVITSILLSFNGYSQFITQPIDKTVCQFNNSYFSVAKQSNNDSLQWQINKSGTWFNIVNSGFLPNYHGINKDTLFIDSIPMSYNNVLYRCVLNNAGVLDTSIIVILKVITPPKIVTNASNRTICENDTTFFEISATDTLLNYNWQINSGSGWSTITAAGSNPTLVGFNSNKITVQNIPFSSNGSQFRCIVEGICQPNDTSNTYLLTVNRKPSIITQPVNKTICHKDTVNFEISAIGTGISYQWQLNRGNGWINIQSDSFPNISGFNTNIITLNNVDTIYNGYQLRSVISGICKPSVISNSVVITVNKIPKIISQSPSQTICEDQSTSFFIVGIGTNLSYKWQVKNGFGNWIDIVSGGLEPTYSGFNSSILNISNVVAVNDGLTFRAIISGICSPSDTSDIFELTVNRKPKILQQPQDINTCEGVSSNFSITDTGAFVTYQWQINSGNGWSNINMQNASPYLFGYNTKHLEVRNPPFWMNQSLFRIIISGVCAPNDTSRVSTLNVFQRPSIIQQHHNIENCLNDSGRLSVIAIGNKLSYQWQIDTGDGWFNIASNLNKLNLSGWSSNELAYQINGIGVFYFRCLISSPQCSQIISQPSSITTNTLPEFDLPAQEFICFGESVGIIPSLSSSVNISNQSWSPSVGLTSPDSLSPIFKPLSTTDYTLTLTSNKGCTYHKSVKIIVNDIPKVTVGYDTTICEGDTFLLNGIGSIYNIWMPKGDLFDNMSLSPSGVGSQTQIYKLISTNEHGCKDSASLRVIVNKKPKISILGDSSVCRNNSMQLIADGASFYSWSPQHIFQNSKTFNPIVRPLSSGFVYVEGVSINGCLKLDSIYINVLELPIINTGQNTNICLGDSVEIGNIGSLFNTWMPKEGLNDFSLEKPIASPKQNTTYILTSADINGCVNIDSVIVNVTNPPLLISDTLHLVCSQSSVQLSVQGATNFFWHPNIFLNANDISDPVSSPLNTIDYTVIGSDDLGCKDSLKIKVKVIEIPDIQIFGDTLVCKNSTNVKYCFSSSINSDWEWSVNNGVINSGQHRGCISVNWPFDFDTGSVGLNLKAKEFPNCKNSSFINIKANQGISPDPISIAPKSNNLNTNILIKQDSEFEFRSWGYESKNNNNEVFTCSSINWCKFDFIDTFNYLYWVYIGKDEKCLTKSYFNQPNYNLSINDDYNDNDILVYPNPFNNSLTISSKQKILSATILDASGRIQDFTSSFYKDELNIKFNFLSNGIYYLKAKTSHGVILKKIIKSD